MNIVNRFSLVKFEDLIVTLSILCGDIFYCLFLPFLCPYPASNKMSNLWHLLVSYSLGTVVVPCIYFFPLVRTTYLKFESNFQRWLDLILFS